MKNQDVKERGESMKYKAEMMVFLVSESQVFENYLEQRAKEGWELRSIHGEFLIFQKREYTGRHYLVRAFPEASSLRLKDSSRLDEFQMQYRDHGWMVLYSAVMWQIFYSDAQERPSSEPESFRARIEKEEKLSRRINFPLPILYFILLAMQLHGLWKYPGETLSKTYYILLIPTLLYVMIFGQIQIIEERRWYKKIRYVMSPEGLPLQSLAKVKRRRVVYEIVLIAVIGLVFITLTGGDRVMKRIMIQMLFVLVLFGALIHWIRKHGWENIRYNQMLYGAGVIVTGVAVGFVAVRSNLFSYNEDETKSEASFPVAFEEIGYGADFAGNDRESHSFLMSFQTAYGFSQSQTADIMPDHVSMTAYESAFPILLKWTEHSLKREYLQKDYRILYRQSIWNQEDVQMVRYEYCRKEDDIEEIDFEALRARGAVYDIYLIKDRNRIQILDFGGATDDEMAEKILKGFS